LIWQDGQVRGVRWIEKDGVHEASAKVVVGADGFYSTVAKMVEPIYENFIPAQRFIYYTYFRGLDTIEPLIAEHHFIGNSLTYIFPTDGDLTMVAISMPIERFAAFKKEPHKNTMAHLESLPLLAPRLLKAEMVSELYGAGNIPSYQRIPYGPGWALVGDAHQILDPWSGMGIDHAATHADMLADALHRSLTAAADWKTSMHAYHMAIREWSKKTYHRTTTYAADFRPMTQAALEKRGLSLVKIS
jgi:flavin-dependent dehydrogenase